MVHYSSVSNAHTFRWIQLDALWIEAKSVQKHTLEQRQPKHYHCTWTKNESNWCKYITDFQIHAPNYRIILNTFHRNIRHCICNMLTWHFGIRMGFHWTGLTGPNNVFLCVKYISSLNELMVSCNAIWQYSCTSVHLECSLEIRCECERIIWLWMDRHKFILVVISTIFIWKSILFNGFRSKQSLCNVSDFTTNRYWIQMNAFKNSRDLNKWGFYGLFEARIWTTRITAPPWGNNDCKWC